MSDDLNSIIPYATLRMRNIAHLSNEECANAIANHLQSSNRFMQNDPKSEQFRMETVRTIPQCLTVKRSVKSQLLTTVNRKTLKRSISCWKLFKYNVSLMFTKVMLFFAEAIVLMCKKSSNLNFFFYIDLGNNQELLIDNKIVASSDKNY